MNQPFFTTKKLTMFILLCIQLAKIAFNFALSPSITNFSFLDLSILVMLILLYVDLEQSRRWNVPIIAAFYIVSLMLPYFQYPAYFLDIRTIFVVTLAVGTFFFGKNLYHNSFHDRLSNWIITIGAGLYVSWLLYNFFPLMFVTYEHPLTFILALFNYLKSMVVPLAMIFYTWFKRFRIE